MRLAALKSAHRNDKIFELAERLVASLLGILTVATNENELVWTHFGGIGGNMFTAAFKGLSLVWDQPNNEPAYLLVEGRYVVEDNGSGVYGFGELSKAIFNQQKTKKAKKR